MDRIAVTALLSLCAAFAQPQTPPKTLKFEVATLKPTQDSSGRGGIRPAQGGERYLATAVPLRLMIMVAYQLKTEQIVGGPDWMNTDRWDMNAKAEKPSTSDELHLMLQDLLAERFQLKFHRETKELPVYVLSVDKAPKMTPHDAASAGDPWIDQAVDRVVQVRLSAKFCPMDYFAWRLGQLLDRPVINKTQIKGGFDFELSYTRDLPPGIREGALLNGEPIDTSGPNIFTAIRQQLGLKLEAQKGPVETLVIDHVEKAAEN
jgi:uncharacterized protein (TIGR03435 family)